MPVSGLTPIQTKPILIEYKKTKKKKLLNNTYKIKLEKKTFKKYL